MEHEILPEHPFAIRTRRRWELWVGMLVLVVYALSLSPHWWIVPDSALYLSLARNLIRGDGYSLAGAPHVHVPPGLPAFLAAMTRLGMGGFIFLNLAMGLMGLATIYLSYRLLGELIGWPWSLGVTAALALSREMIERSGQVLSDVPFMLPIVGALWLYSRGLRDQRPNRGGWEVASLLLVAACWIRVVGFLVAAGMMVGLLLSGWKKARARVLVNVVLTAAGLGASVGFFYWYATHHRAAGASSYLSSLARLAGQYGGWGWLTVLAERVYVASGQLSRMYIAQRLPLVLATLMLVLPVVGAMARRVLRGDWLGPMTTLGYVGGMCLAASIVRTRYFLPIAPLLILYLLEGWAWFARTVVRRRPAAASTAFILLIGIMVGMNLPVAGRDIVSKHRADYFTRQQKGKYAAQIKAAAFLREHRPPAGKYILAEQVVGYMADIDSPTVSRAMADSTPSTEAIAAFLDRWHIAYVATRTGKDGTDFERALADYLGGFGPPVLVEEGLSVYAVPREALEAASGPGSRP